jgi:hypothetical protein
MSSRASYVIASTAWGAAIGILLYRFGVLGLAWTSSSNFLFPAVAVSLSILGRTLIRDQDAPPNKLPLIGAGIVGAGAAIGIAFLVVPPLAQSRLTTHTFPGFTLDLPSGDIRSEDHSYATGKLMIAKNGATSVFAVQWEPGGKLEPDELKMAATMIAPALGAGAGPSSVTQIAGIDTIRFGSDKGQFELSMIPCGVRHVMIATGGSSGIETLHQRILASFVCHPDPAQEKTSGSLPIPLVLDLPGWKVLTRDGPQLQLTDDKAVLILQAVSRDIDMDLIKMIAPMFKAQGMDFEAGANDHGRVPLKLSQGSDVSLGFAQMIKCPTASAMVIALAEDQPTVDEVQAKIAAAHCLKPGEKPQEWPDAPKAPDAPDAPNAPNAADTPPAPDVPQVPKAPDAPRAPKMR